MPTPQYEDVYEPPVMDATFAEKIDELKEAIAPPIPDFVSDAFSVSRAYAVGEYCIYENHFYKFTSAKSAGAWDSTKVQETTLAAEQSSTNSNLAQLEPKTIDSGSMNSINTSGMYYLKNAVTDKPNANGGMFICSFANATTGVGLYVAFVGTGQAVYHCNYSSGTWSSYAV